MLKNSVRLLRNRDGVTLVEVMIALVVLLIVMMGLLQAALLSIDHNLRNMLRDEAVKIAEQRMNGILVPTPGSLDTGEADYNSDYGGYNGLRIIPFKGTKSLSTMAAPAPGAWTAPAVVPRNFRDLTRTYRVCWRIVTVDADTIRIDVAVGWNHRGEVVPQAVGTDNAATTAEYVHQITTLRRAS